MILALDVETYSAVDVKAGLDVYASHWSTGVHCAVLALADFSGPPRKIFRWLPGADLPPWVVEHVRAGHLVLAHNAAFEASILRHVLHPRHGWPTVPNDLWADTAAIAAMNSLPTKLEGLGAILGAPVQKDLLGKKLMLALAEVTYDEETGIYLAPRPSPEQMRRLLDYCEIDVRAMLACASRLDVPSKTELSVLCADRRINARGVYVDRHFASCLQVLARKRKNQLSDDITNLTEGEVFGAAAAGKLKQWLADADVELPVIRHVRADGAVRRSATIGRPAVAELMRDSDLDPTVRAVLLARQEASRATSLAKLARLPSMVSSDGRLRHALRYCGAHTGRWSSKGLQVHNLPKSKMPEESREALRAAVLAQDFEAASSVVEPDNLMSGLSWLLRSVIVAPSGSDLIGGDYSAIEARVLAWLAGQQDVLDAFAVGRDVYAEDARRIDSDDRQLGKVQRLALGYGMGPVKFSVTAANHGVDLSLKRASEVQKLWRKNNPRIVQFWFDLEHACHLAAQHGEASKVGRVLVRLRKACLEIVLPSGRALCYWRPSLRTKTRKVETVDDEGNLIEKELTLTELCYFVEGPDRTRMALDWSYGGKLAENVTQAVARDLLAEALVRLDATSYDVVMHVHDSIVAEVREDEGSVDEFRAIMADPPRWAADLPVAVDVYRSKHFRG